jgi:hypothetical protein
MSGVTVSPLESSACEEIAMRSDPLTGGRKRNLYWDLRLGTLSGPPPTTVNAGVQMLFDPLGP